MFRSSSQRATQRLLALEHELKPATQALTARDSRTLECQLQVARIAAPTGHEQTRAQFVMNELRAVGWSDIEQDSVGNVIARRTSHTHSDVAPVVCLAHLDTAFSEDTALEAVIENGRITCPGIGDNGRGVAAMIALAEVIRADAHASQAFALRRPIEFVFTVGEEGLGNLRGARHYFAERTRRGDAPPHAAIVLDGPGDSRIVHHALGSRRYRISFRGAGGHSWADFGAPNAVHAAGRTVAWLSDLPKSSSDRVALTVSRIGGGESVNAIPADAWIEVDLRATDQSSLGRCDIEIRKIVAAATRSEVSQRAAVASLTSNIQVIGERPCGCLAAEHPLVALAFAATENIGVSPASALASTDANIPLSLGIPAIAIGAGGSGGACHTVHEWYENAGGVRGISRALSVIAGMAG